MATASPTTIATATATRPRDGFLLDVPTTCSPQVRDAAAAAFTTRRPVAD
jgi:hypothetical protein